MGDIYTKLKNYKAAIKEYKKCKNLKKMNLGSTHIEVSQVGQSLANVYFTLGKFSAARKELFSCKHIQLLTYKRRIHNKKFETLTLLGRTFLELK